MATIRISNLRLRAIIGINDWERDIPQDIVINITIEYNASVPAKSDNIDDTIDYKTITKQIIETVEGSKYFLIEKLADAVLDIVLEHPKVEKALVKIDKPHALRFADSVSVEMEKTRS